MRSVTNQMIGVNSATALSVRFDAANPSGAAGFQVTGFGAALLGSLIYSLLGIVIDSALQGLFAES